MIRIVPLTHEHVASLPDPGTEPGLLGVVSAIPKYWDSIVASGTAFAAIIDGRVIACAGWDSSLPGSARVWVWDTPTAREYPQQFHKAARRALNYLEKEKGFWRISCDVRESNLRALRWVELLGFQYEGTQRKFGPDKSDFALYARVEEE